MFSWGGAGGFFVLGGVLLLFCNNTFTLGGNKKEKSASCVK